MGSKVILINQSTVVFHPVWSNSTEGVRGTRILNNSLYYWEIVFGQRVFGTAMMVGIGTAEADLSSQTFQPILGKDGESWGLSHKGYTYHNGKETRYCPAFMENQPTTVGVFFNGLEGTVTFYKDGVCQGVAFRGLTATKKPLFPMVSSTAAKTAMKVQNQRRAFVGLQDRCRDAILERLSVPGDVFQLPVSYHLKEFLLLQSWKTRISKEESPGISITRSCPKSCAADL